MLMRLVYRLAQTIVVITITAMVVAIFGQVFYRGILDSYLTWAEEVARFSFVWLVFVGSACAFPHRGHLGVDILPEMSSHRVRVLLDVLVCLVAGGFAYVLIHHGYRLTLRTMSQMAPTTGIRMGYVYMAMPLAAVLILLQSVIDIVRNVRALWSGDLSKAAVGPRTMAEPSFDPDAAA